MQRAKWFIFGVLATVMLSGTALMASPIMRELVFGVNVSLDGELVVFDDDMQPFIMDNRTFLPVRAIAEIMGLDVGFDGATNTVTLETGASQLIGTWIWEDDDSWIYVFNADGTGLGGFGPNRDAFNWHVHGNTVFMDPLILGENWNFEVAGDALTMVATYSGYGYRYIRAVDDNDRQAEAQPGEGPAASMRGSWAGRVYTNDALGLSFTLPRGWVTLTDAEITDAIGFSADYFGFEAAVYNAFIDMAAWHPATETMVNIVFERRQPGMTPEWHIDIAVENARTVGMRFDETPYTTRIGSRDWQTFATEAEVEGIIYRGQQYHAALDDFMVAITISSPDDSMAPEDIIPFFD